MEKLGLSDFLNEIKSKPVPAAGCVISYNSAMCISLILKVLRITKSKTYSSEIVLYISSCEETFSKLSVELLSFVGKDVDLYLKFVNSIKSGDRSDIRGSKQESCNVLFKIKNSIESGLFLAKSVSKFIKQSNIKADFNASIKLLKGSLMALEILIEENRKI